MIYKTILTFTFIFLMFSCNSGKVFTESDNLNFNKEPQILSMVFQLDGNSISMIQMELFHGNIKERNLKESRLNENDIIVSFLDEQKNVIKRKFVENPLFRSIEVFDENGIQSFEIVNIEKPKFAIRINFDNRIKYLQIEKVKDNITLEKKVLLFENLNIK